MKILMLPFKLVGKVIFAHLKRMRLAWNLQLHDDHWATILWIKAWAFILGAIAALLIYHFVLSQWINEF